MGPTPFSSNGGLNAGQRSTIEELRRKFYERSELSSTEYERAAEFLNSSILAQRAYACEILLRGDCQRNIKDDAVMQLEADCNAHQAKKYASLRIAAAMLSLDAAQLRSKPVFECYAKLLANSKSIGCRTNAILVLERLAFDGNRGAMEQLELLAEVLEAEIREGARKALDRISRGFRR